ncbi:MAG: D-aminoacyl-tRNA deacylase [Nanoarchaeota archaeon]|nr:hypothetical protein [Nanoarchaeota archaeon]MBU1030177.1 hypothetical protein [Nanoarchaeota archaeon]MBU1849576.1 hypothetical protein [Nanoarchaeota archaeon]
MKIAIICPKPSLASKNIKEHLIKLYPFENKKDFYELKTKDKKIRIYSPEKRSVSHENIDEEITADLFIFATTHRSKSQIPSLSAHIQGNWAKAELGGKDKQLCAAPAAYIKEAIKKLEELAQGTHYDVVQECTHHGPYMKKPVFFIEIGSNEKEWQNKDAGEIIAKTIMHVLTMKIPVYQTAVGIGGLHTMTSFKKIIINSGIAIGHSCPKYMLEYLDKEMIVQALEKTEPKADLIIVNWKGLGTEKARIMNILEELNVKWKKTKEF